MEQRRSKRFDLRLPVEVVRADVLAQRLEGETMNVSSGGVLISGPVDVVVGQVIEYYISLPTGTKRNPVRLRCVGKVLRKDEERGTVAATLERYEFVRSNS